MTTKVNVECPAPNHKRVRVRHLYLKEDGTAGAIHKEEILEHGQAISGYVHSGMRLIIDEID